MKKNQKKILIFDVDGTVCESCKPLSKQMARALNRSGMVKTLVFISGGSVQHLEEQISSQLYVSHHLLGTSGCHYVIAKYPFIGSLDGTFETIYHEKLSYQEKQEIISAVKRLIVMADIQSLTTPEDQLQDRDSQITLSAIGRHADKELKDTFDPDGKKREIWREWLLKVLPKDKYDVRLGGTTSLDITKKGMDKAYGIRRFAKISGFNLADMLFFGDQLQSGGNDHSVVNLLDCVAVLNPTDTLRKLPHHQVKQYLNIL